MLCILSLFYFTLRSKTFSDKVRKPINKKIEGLIQIPTVPCGTAKFYIIKSYTYLVYLTN